MCVCVCVSKHVRMLLIRFLQNHVPRCWWLKMHGGLKRFSDEGRRCESAMTTRRTHTHTIHVRYVISTANNQTHPKMIVLHLPINIWPSVSLCSCSLISQPVPPASPLVEMSMRILSIALLLLLAFSASSAHNCKYQRITTIILSQCFHFFLQSNRC